MGIKQFRLFKEATFELLEHGRAADARALFNALTVAMNPNDRRRFAADFAHQLVWHGHADDAFDVVVAGGVEPRYVDTMLAALGTPNVRSTQSHVDIATSFVGRLCRDAPKLARLLNASPMLGALRRVGKRKQATALALTLQNAGAMV